MAEIALLNSDRVASVDDGDYERLAGYRWKLVGRRNNLYAVAYVGGKRTLLHRAILGGLTPDVDHIDGDGLNNVRLNLRPCAHKENIWNRRKLAQASSKFKGVRRSESGAWRAEIQQNGEFLHLGTFNDEARAATQYDRAARVLFGRFAMTNEMAGLF